MQEILDNEIKGHTFISVKKESDDKLIFTRDDDVEFTFWHRQDCCENVWIEDIVGDLSDLENTIINVAEERISYPDNPKNYESTTYTFYEFRTSKGSVTIRWCGESNGYYSERVDLSIKHPKLNEYYDDYLYEYYLDAIKNLKP